MAEELEEPEGEVNEYESAIPALHGRYNFKSPAYGQSIPTHPLERKALDYAVNTAWRMTPDNNSISAPPDPSRLGGATQASVDKGTPAFVKGLNPEKRYYKMTPAMLRVHDVLAGMEEDPTHEHHEGAKSLMDSFRGVMGEPDGQGYTRGAETVKGAKRDMWLQSDLLHALGDEGIHEDRLHPLWDNRSLAQLLKLHDDDEWKPLKSAKWLHKINKVAENIFKKHEGVFKDKKLKVTVNPSEQWSRIDPSIPTNDKTLSIERDLNPSKVSIFPHGGGKADTNLAKVMHYSGLPDFATWYSKINELAQSATKNNDKIDPEVFARIVGYAGNGTSVRDNINYALKLSSMAHAGLLDDPAKLDKLTKQGVLPSFGMYGLDPRELHRIFNGMSIGSSNVKLTDFTEPMIPLKPDQYRKALSHIHDKEFVENLIANQHPTGIREGNAQDVHEGRANFGQNENPNAKRSDRSYDFASAVTHRYGQEMTKDLVDLLGGNEQLAHKIIASKIAPSMNTSPSQASSWGGNKMFEVAQLHQMAKELEKHKATLTDEKERKAVEKDINSLHSLARLSFGKDEIPDELLKAFHLIGDDGKMKPIKPYWWHKELKDNLEPLEQILDNGHVISTRAIGQRVYLPDGMDRGKAIEGIRASLGHYVQEMTKKDAKFNHPRLSDGVMKQLAHYAFILSEHPDHKELLDSMQGDAGTGLRDEVKVGAGDTDNLSKKDRYQDGKGNYVVAYLPQPILDHMKKNPYLLKDAVNTGEMREGSTAGVPKPLYKEVGGEDPPFAEFGTKKYEHGVTPRKARYTFTPGGNPDSSTSDSDMYEHRLLVPSQEGMKGILDQNPNLVKFLVDHHRYNRAMEVMKKINGEKSTWDGKVENIDNRLKMMEQAHQELLSEGKKDEAGQIEKEMGELAQQRHEFAINAGKVKGVLRDGEMLVHNGKKDVGEGTDVPPDYAYNFENDLSTKGLATIAKIAHHLYGDSIPHREFQVGGDNGFKFNTEQFAKHAGSGNGKGIPIESVLSGGGEAQRSFTHRKAVTNSSYIFLGRRDAGSDTRLLPRATTGSVTTIVKKSIVFVKKAEGEDPIYGQAKEGAEEAYGGDGEAHLQNIADAYGAIKAHPHCQCSLTRQGNTLRWNFGGNPCPDCTRRGMEFNAQYHGDNDTGAFEQMDEHHAEEQGNE